MKKYIIIFLILLIVLSTKITMAQGPRDCYYYPCYRYVQPNGINYDRWFYTPMPLYKGYWPGVGYYNQYPNNYDMYTPSYRPNDVYIRCAQPGSYYLNECRYGGYRY